ncbi:MAG: tRNA lysidine(34) synthetase TilS [Anaerolineae bacterium]
MGAGASGPGDEVLKKVRRAARRHNLLPGNGEPLVVGVSGGADSLCLLHALVQLGPEFGYSLHVGHLHHGLRGEEAEEDARFVQSICQEWGVSVTVERFDVAALAKRAGLSVEEAGRKVRYAFLAGLAAQLGGEIVAVAHNADDQAETVLMHWLRGAGLAGLRGMLPAVEMRELRVREVWGDRWPPVEHVRIVRPLLEVTRTEIESYCRHFGLKPRFDLSNLDTTYYRNRLRHDLLPHLETYNPRIRQILCRSAQVIADDYAYLRAQTLEAWSQVVREEAAGRVVFDLPRWRDLPASLQRGVLREAIRRLRRDLRNINWVHVERAMEGLLEGPTGTAVTLAQGLALRKGYNLFQIADEGVGLPTSWEWGPWIEGTVGVPLPGRVKLPGSGWQVETEVLQPEEPLGVVARFKGDHWTAVLDAGRLVSPLTLRARRPGDRFRPSGMDGASVLVREFMINIKLPSQVRGRWPLLCSGEEIVWVIGWRVDETYAVTEGTRDVVVVRLKAPEREGEPWDEWS